MPRRAPRALLLAGVAAAATIPGRGGMHQWRGPRARRPAARRLPCRHPTPTSSVPTGTGAGPACGFVPAAALADVLGTTRYETAGSLTRTEPARTGACSVIAPDNNAPAIQVTVGPGSISRAGASAVATVEGTNVTGALSHLVRARDAMGVRLLRPRPGRDSVHDAVSLATAVAEELGLPVH